MTDAPLPVIIGMVLVDLSKVIVEDVRKAIYPCTIKQPVIAIASTTIFCGIYSFAFPKASFTGKCFTYIAVPTMTACLTVVIIASKRFQFYKALSSNKEALLTELQKNGSMLQYGGEFRKDFDAVLEAVGQNGLALKYADITMRSNKEIVKKAFDTARSSLKHADSTLQNDENFILELAKIDEKALQYADDRLMKNDGYLLKAIEIDAFYALFPIKNSSDLSDHILLAAIKKDVDQVMILQGDKRISNIDFLESVIETNYNYFHKFDWQAFCSPETIQKLNIRLDLRSRTSTKSSGKMLPSDS